MRLLSIDQSFTSSGYCVFDNNQLISFGIISSDPSKLSFERAQQIVEQCSKIASQFHITHIAIEGLAFSKFGNATRDLAGLQFILVYQLQLLENYPIEIISPNSVKKFATGTGKAKKQDMYNALPETVKQQFLESGAKKTKGLYDLTDAYFIGECYAKTIYDEHVSQ